MTKNTPQDTASPSAINQNFDAIAVARRVLSTEQDGLAALAQGLDDGFNKAVQILAALSGRTILAGVGKSGHVARKIAATMASTGTPALFVHPTEASHGDMGMLKPEDAVIALSRSGETRELADMIAYCKRFAIPLIAMTCKPDSTLARASTICLTLPDTPEACAVTGAPTTSTTLQMALGDALAVALLEGRGFTSGDFKTFHPGGALGAQLAIVDELMHGGDHMPLSPLNAPITDALAALGDKGFGCVGIVDGGGVLVGIITDGDIRRHLDKNLLQMAISDIMTAAPKTAKSGTMAAQALHQMTAQDPKIMQLFITDHGKPVGILHMHDLLRGGLG